ncbi:hypothetical protein CRG98_037103, partial [Punica granatum]
MGRGVGPLCKIRSESIYVRLNNWRELFPPFLFSFASFPFSLLFLYLPSPLSLPTGYFRSVAGDSMAETPQRRQSPRKPKLATPKLTPKPSPSPFPVPPETPATATPLRRSARRSSLSFKDIALKTQADVKSTGDSSKKSRRNAKETEISKTPSNPISAGNDGTQETSNSARKLRRRIEKELEEAPIAPVSPEQSESRKRKKGGNEPVHVVTRARASRGSEDGAKKRGRDAPKKKVYYK